MDFLKDEKDADIIFTEALTMFFSGVHTSNSLLSFTVHHLAKNPDIQTKLQEELDLHIPGNIITDVNQLRGIRYLRACINEAARLTPLVNIATRINPDSEINFDDGHMIPKNTPIILPLALVLKDHDLWDNSDTYRPERFRAEGIKCPYQFSPFGFAGGRICPGKYLAQVEIQFAIATLFKNFRVTLDKDQGPLKFRYLTATSSVDEIYAHFHYRH